MVGRVELSISLEGKDRRGEEKDHEREREREARVKRRRGVRKQSEVETDRARCPEAARGGGRECAARVVKKKSISSVFCVLQTYLERM